MSDPKAHVRRIITDLWDPTSKVKEEDVHLLLHHLRTSFSDHEALLQALRADSSAEEQKLAELEARKERLIDHNLEE